MLGWLKSNTPAIDGADQKAIVEQINQYVDEACSGKSTFYADAKVKETVNGKQLIDSEPDRQIVILYTALECYIKQFKKIRKPGLGITYTATNHCPIDALQQLAVQLLRRKLPYEDAQLLALLKLSNDNWDTFSCYRPHNALLGVLERHYAEQTLPDSIVKEVKRAIRHANGIVYTSAEDRKFIERAKSVIGEGEPAALKGDFNWSKTIIKEVSSLTGETQANWQAMLTHAQTAHAAKPAKKWQATAQTLVDKIGGEQYAETVCCWLSLLLEEKYDALPLRDDLNATIVRGLIWGAALVEPDWVARDIKLTTIYCFRKVKDVGAVSVKVGNACLYVLGQLPGMDSVSMLSELLLKIKYPSAKRMVEKALDGAAERNNMSREDLMEISVPDYGLDEQGEYHQQFDDTAAIVRIGPEHKVELVWQKPEGKIQKTVPASIKQAYAQDIKDLKKTIKDIRTTLQSQSARIETCLLKPSTWTYQQWCDRFCDHHLLQHISHKLIWHFELDNVKYSAMLIDGQMQNCQGKAVDINFEQAQVWLWHPVYADVDEIMHWRNLIADQEITQPFKQAHREVYLVTDAERATEQYSNRFASHILKQHQLNALCQQRGWHYTLQGNFDSWNSPTRHLPQWDMTVEFYVDGVESSDNDMGILNYVSSDQVRFLRERAPIRVEDVEPIVFTELMRDVDLFIGVCSIGNDPGWQDSGLHQQFNGYWSEYAFGDLMESAKTRKDVLTRLLPKLKIADVCEISGRFLKVQGEYRMYKIHLGSANILMEPNDQYLCIVEGRTSKQADTNKLILPFEGDHRMAVILSKAFLLANDKKITDKTILSQIRRRG